MAAVLHPTQFHSQRRTRASTSPGILINPLPPTAPSNHTQPLLSPSNNKFISNAPSNNSLSSSSSSLGNNTDDGLSSNSHQSVSQSGSGETPAHDDATTRPGARSSSIPSVRRIRFAPLPDPRALESDDGDGTLVGIIPGVSGDAISARLDSTAAPAAAAPPSSSTSACSTTSQPPPPIAISSTVNSAPCGDIALNTSTSTLPDPYDTTPTNPTTRKGTSSSWTSKPKNLFKPFLRRSSSPLAPASSGLNISTEDILTLGTINLFRTSSGGSRSGSASVSSGDSEGNGNGLGLSLNRWTSARSYGAHGKEWFGSPLARTESTQSYKGDVRGRSTSTTPIFSAKSKSKPSQSSKSTSKSTNTPPLKSRRKGTRMLNGRVYGGHRIDAQNTNLFVTAKDEEPEFVEWGYGGMGSVKAGKQHGGTQWSRLQSNSAGVGGGGVDDDDDGGGMTWVRKRREQRERERKEKEEKAKAEAEAGVVQPSPVSVVDNQASDPPPPSAAAVEEQPKQDQTSTPAPASISPIDDLTTPTLDQTQPRSQPQLPVLLPAPPDENTGPDHNPSGDNNNTDKDKKLQHITTTVNVPAPGAHHHYHHHRSASYVGSNTSQSGVNSSVSLLGSGGVVGRSEGDKEWEVVMSPLRMSFEGVGDVERAGVVVGEKVQDDNVSASGSESSESEDGDGDESEGGDDEPEDEEEAERIRKTALGAGVEKISRHKDGG